jgi:glycosyltransferase involved in cell wall biosynthesis
MIFGMLRVKNEARWFGRVLDSIKPLCDKIFVFDDHSTDATPNIAEAAGAVVLRSPFRGLDESRDKNLLLSQIWGSAKVGDWVVCIDGDEELEPGGAEIVKAHLGDIGMAFSLPVVYLWNSPAMARVDGVYGRFERVSIFRLLIRDQIFPTTNCGGHFHCGNVPPIFMNRSQRIPARLLHYGYMDRADRLRKFEWYTRIDKNNVFEDGYRHMVQGDIDDVPAAAVLRHAGPLKLVGLKELQ